MKKILFACFLFSYTSFGQVNLNVGLRAYYPFSGNANDVSGNNNNPAFNNAALTADRAGNPNSAYHFNGINNYIQVPNSPSLNMGNKISMSLWVKPTGYNTDPCYNNMLVAKSDAVNVPSNYFLVFADVYSGCTNPTTTQERFHGQGPVAQFPIIQLNQWYSVVWTYDGSWAKIYVDCVLRDSLAMSTTSFTNSFDLYMGKLNSAQYPFWFNGDLDEVRIYDRALTIDEVNVLGGCLSPLACNNWLSTPSQGSYVTVGDLDVSGNQLTIEANYNRTFPLNNGIYPGHLVSKHTNTTDNNYSLFPNGCAVTTDVSGYKETFESCPFIINKTNHVAMVYDGAVLKYYRNGFLMSQIACTGNLVTNNLQATIASIADPGHPAITQFLGNINEVRVWNVARSQSQLQLYMNSSIPDPVSQPGLLAYYRFDNLQNKKGNALYNGVLNGGAAINATNPNCSFTADSCAAATNIINDYTPVTGFNICENKITVEDATRFNTGDTVVMMQMKGAVIDSANTATFGTITDYKNAGNYEFNLIKSKTGNIIELKNKFTRQYDIPLGKVQLIRVPYFNSYKVTSTLTCLPWNGSKGGVLVVNVRDTLELNADINTSGNGFLKGTMRNSNNNTYTCGITDYYLPDNTLNAAGKGEGISFLSALRNSGKGPAANGGGGGMNTNSGGAGGANGNKGGRGGYEWNNCPNYLTSQNWGFAGNNLVYSNSSNKVFMGGGGGAGHCNNQFDDPSFNADYNGGNGGAIVIINAAFLKNNNKKIISRGDSAYQPVYSPTFVTHDGMGGGGAGGTVLFNINNYINTVLVDVSGGKGANMVAEVAVPGNVGPGGGGGGGVVWVKQSSIPVSMNITNTGGNNGNVVLAGNIPFGAAPGLAGINVFSLVVPVASVAFKKNIDSVRIRDSATSCRGFDFTALTYTNSYPVNAWVWSFGDGSFSSVQNPSHLYPAEGAYTVALVVTDINGCRDTMVKNIITKPAVADAGNDTTVCTGNTATLHASPGTVYSWTPAAFLNNPALQNPVATVTATTRFYLTVTNALGCNATDSVLVSVSSSLIPSIAISTPLNTICKGKSATFNAIVLYGGASPTFQWQKNGISVGTNSNTYTDNNLADGDIIKCKLISSVSCASPDSVESNSIVMTVANPPNNTRYPTVSTLINQPLQLLARNIGISYLWNPATGLNNKLIINPVYIFNQTLEYTITIITPLGCQVVDTQLVKISGAKGIYVPKGFTPDGNGTNDRLYPILVGIKQLIYFRVYNRWGNLIFETNNGNPAAGWDGKFNGLLQPEETYTWTAEAIDIDNIVIKKSGNSFLIR